jgi:predicted amidohydrolase
VHAHAAGRVPIHTSEPAQKSVTTSTVRIAHANIRVPSTPDESVCLATSAVADASRQGATVICFPECFVPGYRWRGTPAPPPDPPFLERAWVEVAAATSAPTSPSFSAPSA